MIIMRLIYRKSIFHIQERLKLPKVILNDARFSTVHPVQNYHRKKLF